MGVGVIGGMYEFKEWVIAEGVSVVSIVFAVFVSMSILNDIQDSSVIKERGTKH